MAQGAGRIGGVMRNHKDKCIIGFLNFLTKINIIILELIAISQVSMSCGTGRSMSQIKFPIGMGGGFGPNKALGVIDRPKLLNLLMC